MSAFTEKVMQLLALQPLALVNYAEEIREGNVDRTWKNFVDLVTAEW